MERIKLFGLTGQSGAGKSTVARIFEENGFLVIDADRIVAELYNGNSACLMAVASQFGKDIIKPQGGLDRALLAKRAFSSEQSKALLNRLVHPFVTARLFEVLKEHPQVRAAVFDAPQLFESNADVICDAVICVIADTETRLQRICRRDNISVQQAMQRIKAQLDEDYFKKHSDFILENNGSENSLNDKAVSIINRLKNSI